jgi:N-acetylglucosaminyl-diphospho-decaprenol L-rhamnosyltransferase
MISVSIVVVSWNTRDLLRSCLQSIIATAPAGTYEIIVVDNASADGSPQMVREEFPAVRLIENSDNRGFAAANNQAFPLCSGAYVLLLNSDATLRPAALERLVAFLEGHPAAGVVGPKVVHPQQRMNVLSGGYLPSVRTVFNHFFLLFRLFPERPGCRGLHLLIGVHDDRPRRVEWIAGVCFLVRAAVIQQVGPLSDQWFMYAEDMEWSERIGRGGWELHHVPDAVVEHWGGASTKQNATVSTMWVASLRSYFILRAQPSRPHLLLFDAILIAGLASRILLYLKRSLLDRRQRAAWRGEARRFVSYTSRAWSLMRAPASGTREKHG